MKKWQILLILAVLVAFIVLGIFFLIRGVSKVSSSDNTDAVQIDGAEIESYVKTHWPQYEAEYDAATDTLQLSGETVLSYEEARFVGGRVYADSTAPETYLDAVSSITVDLIAQFGNPKLKVTLAFLSTEGTPIFTVSSDGTMETCWE